MIKNNEIENNRSKQDKAEASETGKEMSREVFQGDRKDFAKSLAAMDQSKTNTAKGQLPELTIVDVSALSRGIDANGHFVGDQANQLRSAVGHEAAEKAMGEAKMMHASNVTAEHAPENNMVRSERTEREGQGQTQRAEASQVQTVHAQVRKAA